MVTHTPEELPLLTGTRVKVNNPELGFFHESIGTVVAAGGDTFKPGNDTAVVLDGAPWMLEFHNSDLETTSPFAIGQRVMAVVPLLYIEGAGTGHVGTVVSYHFGCDAVRVKLDVQPEGAAPLWFDVTDVAAVDE